MAKLSPLAPASFPECHNLAGARFGTTMAGGAYGQRDDLLLVIFDQPTVVAGVFTQSRCASAPVDWSSRCLASPRARGLVVNAGNANAFTGKKGAAAAAETARLAAEAIGCSAEEILLASTGVIGEPLSVESFGGHLRHLADIAQPNRWRAAAAAIMTTDTFAKAASDSFTVSGKTFSITGFTKGSGMIAPDMATMLGFVFTDFPIEADLLQMLLRRSADKSFNAITVDSDTSTSDTVLAFSTAIASDNQPRAGQQNDPGVAAFTAAFDAVLLSLAQQIVRDGEGASKFVTVTVSGAETDSSAKIIAKSIANSPLVKTAIAGEDANWGRVVMAVGKAGEPADRDLISIWFNGVQVADEGERDKRYDEEEVSKIMTQQDIEISVALGIGTGQSTVWTCDLTHDYIAINADYRS